MKHILIPHKDEKFDGDTVVYEVHDEITSQWIGRMRLRKADGAFVEDLSLQGRAERIVRGDR